jgi:hypothetical protein
MIIGEVSSIVVVRIGMVAKGSFSNSPNANLYNTYEFHTLRRFRSSLHQATPSRFRKRHFLDNSDPGCAIHLTSTSYFVMR